MSDFCIAAERRRDGCDRLEEVTAQSIHTRVRLNDVGLFSFLCRFGKAI